MNRTLNIIPTPKFCQYTEGDKLSVSKVCIVGTADDVLLNALQALGEVCKLTHAACNDAQLIIYPDYAQIPQCYLDTEDRKNFEEKFSAEQGYVLKTLPTGQLAIMGQSQLGCAYGVLTLLQIIGQGIGSLIIRDYPDFRYRGIKWLIWAETGAWSYDFGDGVEAIERRMKRNIDLLFKYKINYVFADGFGFDSARFDGYADVMRNVCDYARKRGIKVACGGYSMSYGMTAHLDSYQGKDFYNRKSYPDGEIYECLGTYVPDKFPYEWRTLNHGTCLSNNPLFELKMDELTEYVRKTHITALSLHNMDAHDILPGLWETRCSECRKRWPNPSLYAKDGAAGAFAEFIDKIMERLKSVKDGDYNAAQDLVVRMVSPGYMYYSHTTDEDFEVGVKFWEAVSQYIEHKEDFLIGFREEQFYHDRPVLRVESFKNSDFKVMTAVSNFCGSDGFYDDKLFTTTAAFSYAMKGFDAMTYFNGNAFQEPLQVFNAEYSWNAENSSFYNISPRPENYTAYTALFKSMIASQVRPQEVYGDGGFLDIICQKLYGKEIGLELGKLYKLSGKNGEPPIPFASNVDIFTNYSRVEYPMRWDNEMTQEDILAKHERFSQCCLASQQAHAILDKVLNRSDVSDGLRENLTCFRECFYMGAMLCDLLTRYMELYQELRDCFDENRDKRHLIEQILELQNLVDEFGKYVNSLDVKPVDKFEGIFIRRKEMADFLVYNTDIMLASIRQNKRIPDGLRDAIKHEWY